jgi:hypothetical protein
MKALIAGAQTERRGEAGPVRVLRRGWDAPAALFAYVAINPARKRTTDYTDNTDNGRREIVANPEQSSFQSFSFLSVLSVLSVVLFLDSQHFLRFRAEAP